MSEEIVSQEEQEVKQECEIGECHEPVFRDTLCWYHFCQEVVDEWAGEGPEEEEYIFGDPPPYGCSCVLPEQHCPDCEVAAAKLYGGDELPF